jgi:NIPSNAP
MLNFTSDASPIDERLTHRNRKEIAYHVLGGMIHQLRIYEIFDKNKEAFHNRFREQAWRIMRSYGFNILGTWETRMGERTEFVYLLAWPDERTMRQAWEQFRANEEWKEIKKITNARHGDLVGDIQDRTLTPTSYSPAIPGER